MAQKKTYPELGAVSDVQAGDILASWRGSGPLKRVTAQLAADFSVNAGTYVPPSPAINTRPMGQKVGDIIALEDIGAPGANNDYSDVLATQAANYEFATIEINQPEIRLGFDVSGLSSLKLRGKGKYQTTIRVVDVIDFQSCNFLSIQSVALLPLGGYTGVGLLLSGTSSSCDISDIYAANFLDRAVHFKGTVGGQQSENNLTDFLFANCGSPTNPSYEFEYSSDHYINDGSVGATAPANPSDPTILAGTSILNSSEGFIGDVKHYNFTNGMRLDTVSGLRSLGTRTEESYHENIVMNAVFRSEFTAFTAHTASKASSTTYDNVSLVGCADNIFSPTVARSFDNTIKSKNGFAASGGSVRNRIIGGIILDYNLLPVAGSGWTVSGVYPASANTGDTVNFTFQGGSVATGPTVSWLNPGGKALGPAEGGFFVPRDGFITIATYYTFAAPGSGETFTAELRRTPLGGAAATLGTAVISGSLSTSSNSMAAVYPVSAGDLVNVMITPSNSATVTSHIVQATYSG